MIVPIIALYAKEIGATVATIGLVVGMYSIINTPANILLGSLIDRFGCKIPLILGFIGDSICMFLYTLCNSPEALLLVRGLHGLTGSVLGPATMYLVAQYSTLETRGRAMGFYGMAMGLAPLIGFMITGAIIGRHLGFSAVFYTGSFLLLVGLMLALILALSLPKAERMEVRRRGVSMEVGRIIALVRKGPVAASYLCVFSLWFTFGCLSALLPLHMKGLGMTAFHFSMVLTVLTLSFIALQYAFGLLSDRVGRKIPSVIGLVLISISVWLFATLTSFYTLMLTGILCGIGVGSLFPSISAMLCDNTEESERGIATGIFHALVTGGVAVGAPIMGLVAEGVGVRLAIALSSLVTIASMFAVMAFVRRARRLKRAN
jgi:MFS family permease